MKKISTLIVVFVFIGLIFLLQVFKTPKAEVQKPQRQDLETIIPKNSFLRENKEVNQADKFNFLIYVENPKFDADVNQQNLGYFATCDGMNMGRGIEGVYHLATTDGNKIISDTVIPGDEYFNKLEATNSASTTNKIPYQKVEDFYNRKGDSPLVPTNVELINWIDANGDGVANETMISGNNVGCALVDQAVVGYSNDKSIKIFPFIGEGKTQYWMDHLSLLKPGEIEQEWKCGDHGMPYDELIQYEFDSAKQAFILKSHTKNNCTP